MHAVKSGRDVRSLYQNREGSTNKTIVRKYRVERQEKCVCGWREIPAGTKVEVMADTTGRAGPAAVCPPARVVRSRSARAEPGWAGKTCAWLGLCRPAEGHRAITVPRNLGL